MIRPLLAMAVSAMLIAGCAGTALTSSPPSTTTVDPTSRPTAGPTGIPSLVPLPEGIAAHPADSEGNELGVLSYVPPAYGDDDGVSWPLLVFLHGSDEYGDGNEAQLRKLLSPGHGIPSMIAAGAWPA